MLIIYRTNIYTNHLYQILKCYPLYSYFTVSLNPIDVATIMAKTRETALQISITSYEM